ncbi:MAG: hypothetical protein VYE73_14785, partial [Acidobacteriota bacterium]|nr:hypothetical protein [Acidobacteriota bacterium]
MSPGEIAWNWGRAAFLVYQALLVTGSLSLLYRFRKRLGPAPFLLAVGAIQFLQVLLRRGTLGAGDAGLSRPEGGIFLAATLYSVLLVYA